MGSHSSECAGAHGGLCTCGCHGTKHGQRHLSDRAAKVTITAVHGEHGGYRVVTESGEAPGGGVRSERPTRAAVAVEPRPVATREQPPPPDRIALVTDHDLANMFGRYTEAEDWNALAAVDVEMLRRERLANPPARTGEAWLDGPDKADDAWGTLGDDDGDAGQRLDELVAAGWEWHEAYGHVHGQDPDRLRREERGASLDPDRLAGESRERALRRAYDTHVHERWLRAETETRGHMLSREGKGADINPVTLFSGPAVTARRYASEDLMRWWADNGGRQTYTEFRADALGRRTDLVAAERSRLGGNDRDFI